MPLLLHDFGSSARCHVQLVEDKTIRLLPRLLSGRLDLAFVRPPESPDRRLEFLFLFHETAVVAVPANHPLAGCEHVSITDLADQPLIVPERRSRPHSHDLTIKLFSKPGSKPASCRLPTKSRPSSTWSRRTGGGDRPPMDVAHGHARRPLRPSRRSRRRGKQATACRSLGAWLPRCCSRRHAFNVANGLGSLCGSGLNCRRM